MSILHNNKNNFYIDHCKYISNIYQKISGGETESCEFNKKLFYIFRNPKVCNRKRKLVDDELQKECSEVKAMYEEFMAELPISLKTECKMKTESPCNTSDVRNLAQNLFGSTVFDHKGINGGNNSDISLRSTIKDESFLIPPNSRFYCGCVSEQCKKLAGEKFDLIIADPPWWNKYIRRSWSNACLFCVQKKPQMAFKDNQNVCRFYCGCVSEQCKKLAGEKFDLIIADPPWWNKYIRRLKNVNNKLSYSMMYNEDIASIPIKSLLAQNSLVAVWCTNAPSNIAAVKDLIFPQWGVEYVTTWYWLKVTTDFEPLCDFGTGCKKQPYERIILGKVGDVNVPQKQLVVSVPSALHSHKPPLLDLLSPFVNVPNPRSLELFARYLLPNTTSIGYEPLKWQHISLYDKVS